MHAAVGHRRHVGFAQANGSGGAQTLNGERIAISDQVFKGRAAGGGCQALDQVTVFGGIGDPVQRAEGFTPGATGVRRFGFFKGFGVAHHHRVQRGRRLRAVIGLDACKVRLDQLNRGGLARIERFTQLGNGNFSNFDHALTAEG